MPLERFRGPKWAVVLKAESGVSAALFRPFSTVRASSFMCPSGSAAYFELEIVRMGTYRKFGFCSVSFQPSDMLKFEGVGDSSSSWGVDGGRLVKYHQGRHTLEGRRWQEGDVIGLACNLQSGYHASYGNVPTDSNAVDQHDGGQTGGSMWVSVNGDFSPPYGLVFHLPQGLSGLFAAFSSQSGVVRCNLGEKSFKHAPPAGDFKPMCTFPAA
jgi:hypothetical protein